MIALPQPLYTPFRPALRPSCRANRLHPLLQEALHRLLERISDLKKGPDKILFQQISTPTPVFLPPQEALCAVFTPSYLPPGLFPRPRTEVSSLPEASSPFTLYISFMHLHRCSDPAAYLRLLQDQMAPNDLFLAVFPGEKTLFELKTSFIEAETALSGGINARFSPLMPLFAANRLLQESGFDSPVADREEAIVLYRDIYAIAHDLRLMGETNTLSFRPKSFTKRALFMHAQAYYASHFKNKEGLLKAKYELLFIHGFKNNL